MLKFVSCCLVGLSFVLMSSSDVVASPSVIDLRHALPGHIKAPVKNVWKNALVSTLHIRGKRLLKPSEVPVDSDVTIRLEVLSLYDRPPVKARYLYAVRYKVLHLPSRRTLSWHQRSFRRTRANPKRHKGGHDTLKMAFNSTHHDGSKKVTHIVPFIIMAGYSKKLPSRAISRELRPR